MRPTGVTSNHLVISHLSITLILTMKLPPYLNVDVNMLVSNLMWILFEALMLLIIQNT